MIDLTRNNKKVFINIESGLSSEPRLPFSFECSSEMAAELLYRHLDDRVIKRIEEIRKMEYESGYKAARKKERKSDWFWITLTDKNY
jgi:hypothetical protein